MLNNMRQIKINPLNMWKLGSNSFEGDTKTATNIHQLLHVLKSPVNLYDVFDDNCTMIIHSFVENLIEPGVQPRILKRVRSMDSIKWNSSFKNSIFQLGP